MVADNDLALGQVVEALTKSRFWPKMAIFIVEDDAQNGVDHVDGHRTTGIHCQSVCEARIHRFDVLLESEAC